MDLEYNVTILRPSELDVAKICVWRVVDDDKIKVYVPVVEGGKVVWAWKLKDAKKVPPASFEIPATFGRQGVMQKLADELFEQYSIKPKVSASEDATDNMKDHLEDLRTLIFKFDFTRMEKGAPLVEEKE